MKGKSPMAGMPPPDDQMGWPPPGGPENGAVLDAVGSGVSVVSVGPQAEAGADAAEASADAAADAALGPTGPSPEERREAEEAAATKIQAGFRGKKARDDLQANSKISDGKHSKDEKDTKDGPRAPQEGQKLSVLCKVESGSNMPDVNTFGGCDPMVEVRCVQAAAAKKADGDVQSVPLVRAETTSKTGDMKPKWDEEIVLDGCTFSAKEWHLQVILFDYNMTGNTPIGHTSLSMEDALEGLTFDAAAAARPEKSHTLTFKSLLPPGTPVNATVKCSFSFKEYNKFKLLVVKGSRLPKVDTLGTIDGFIEARLTTKDPRKSDFIHSPGEECMWNAQTKAVENSMDPKWAQELGCTIPGDPKSFLQIILWDQGSITNTPLGQHVIPVKEIVDKVPGVWKEMILKLSALPGVASEFNQAVKLARITVKLKFDLVLETRG